MNQNDIRFLREEVKEAVRKTIPEIVARLERLETMPGSTAKAEVDEIAKAEAQAVVDAKKADQKSKEDAKKAEADKEKADALKAKRAAEKKLKDLEKSK